MRANNIKKLVISILAELLMLITLGNLYKFLMYTDGLTIPVTLFNLVLFVAFAVGIVLNYIYIIVDIDIE